MEQQQETVRPEWVSPIDGRTFPFGEPTVWVVQEEQDADPMCRWWE